MRLNKIILFAVLVYPFCLFSAEEILVLDMENSLAISLTNHPDLKAIHTKQTTDKLKIWESFRDLFPSLSVSYMQTDEIRKREQDSRQKKLSFDSEIMVYDGGQKKLAYDITKLESILSRNDYKTLINKIVHETKSAYLGILQEKKAIEIYKKSLEKGRMQLFFAAKELELGETTLLNKLDIEAKVKEIEINLNKSYEKYNNALKNFKVMLRLNWQKPVEITGTVENYEIFQLDDITKLEDLINTAFQNRKEIQSSDVEYEIAKRKYYMADEYYLPKVSVGVNYALSDEKFMPREKSWGITLKVSSAIFGNSISGNTGYNEQNNQNSRSYSNNATMNVLDSMSYKRAVVEAESGYVAAKNNRTNLRQKIAVEISSLYESLKNNWEITRVAKKQVELYDSLLEIEKVKVQLGETRRYDYVVKEIERDQSEVNYISAIVTYIIQVSSTENSLGLNAGNLNLVKVKEKE